MANRRGTLIAIEGIDQAGKRTQANLLAAKLRREGTRVSIWSFPDYTTSIGKVLKGYLRRETQLDFHSVHLLYAANKWEVVDELSHRIKRGETVIVNRYTPSNIAYGSAHGLGVDWLSSLERGLPEPDIVLVLDVPPHVSRGRKRKGRDIHEDDFAYLNRVRQSYTRLSKKYGWTIIDGTGDQETVRRLVWVTASAVLVGD